MASLRENWLLVPYSAHKKSCQFPSSEPESPNFKFDGMVFSKSYIAWTKNCGRGFISWHWKAMESFGKNWLQVFNSAQEKFCGFSFSEPEGRDFIFDGSGFSKRYIGSAKNCGTSFTLLHWKGIESFGKKMNTGLQLTPEKVCEFCVLPSFGPLTCSKNFYHFLGKFNSKPLFRFCWNFRQPFIVRSGNCCLNFLLRQFTF